MKKGVLKYCFIIICIIMIIVGALFAFKAYNGEENETDEEFAETGDSDDLITEETPEQEKDLFDEYYSIADEKVESMTLDEKIGQILLVRYPEENALEIVQNYNFGGYLLFEKDFRNKTEDEIKNKILELQNASKIPLLIAVDEEGGTVIRVSSNKNLKKEKFKSPSELYKIGGFEKIAEDTSEKSAFLSNLGINLNLAPVVDVSTDSKDYIYSRTLGEGTELTAEYSKTVINASKNGSVSFTLKHFPGYGSNVDTHNGSSVDNKSYEEILEYNLPPFQAGIDAGAEAVLVSHNIVTNIDSENPASLSEKIHELLRNELDFTGVIITDDLHMGAVSNIQDATVKALIAGNDLLIVTDYERAINEIKTALDEGRIGEEAINSACRQVIAWKYFKNMGL